MTAEEDRARFAALRRAQALLDGAYRRAVSGEVGRLAEDHLPAMSALSADLLMSGWVGCLPDGGEAAFLLLTVAHPGAPAVMPLVAAACGLDPAPDAVTERVDPAVCRVEVGADGWIRLRVGADYATAPVGAEGAAMMLTQRRAVLVVGHEPMPPGLDGPGYADRYPGRCSLGVVPATGGYW